MNKPVRELLDEILKELEDYLPRNYEVICYYNHLRQANVIKLVNDQGLCFCGRNGSKLLEHEEDMALLEDVIQNVRRNNHYGIKHNQNVLYYK